MLIDVSRMSLAFGDKRILDDINLTIPGGELVAMLGPSGSGKSTLLKAMTAIHQGEGTVRIDGKNLYEEEASMRRLIGYVPQDDILHRTISVEKVLTYAAMLRLELDDEEKIEAEVDRVLAQVGLSDRREVKVKSLSGGQRKRVSIAIELLAEPPLMFMDEPTSGLDPALEEQMMALFRGLTTADRITVVTTHVTASLDLVDRAILLAKGKKVYDGPPAGIPAHFGAKDLPEVYRILAKL